jgi:endonuclease YncB( thermonuclease family)
MLRAAAVALLVAALGPPPAGADAPASGAARASGPVELTVAGRTVRLAGLAAPAGTTVRLARADVLDLLLAERTVTCRPAPPSARPAAPAPARCTADGLDLAVPLLLWGLARTTPDAPERYRTLEGIAGAFGRGVWGE